MKRATASSAATAAQTALIEYQKSFCAYLRTQGASPRPAGSSARGMKAYCGLLLNNIEGFLTPCFPVCQQMIGKRRWQKLVRAFFAQHAAASPYFREIPQAFLAWLPEYQLAETLPPWFSELAHWEWVELAVSVHPAPPWQPDKSRQPLNNIMATHWQFNPSIHLACYNWPVQRIAPRRKIKAESVWLLAYRDTASRVRFVELTAGSYALLLRLHSGESMQQVLTALARQWQRPAAPLAEYAGQLLNEMRQLGVLRSQSG